MRAATNTVMPCSASRRAMSNPMPLLAVAASSSSRRCGRGGGHMGGRGGGGVGGRTLRTYCLHQAQLMGAVCATGRGLC